MNRRKLVLLAILAVILSIAGIVLARVTHTWCSWN